VPPLPATARRASAAGGARTRAPDRSTAGGTGPASIGGGNCGEGHADLPPDLPATARTPRLRAVAGRNRTLPPTRLRAHHPWGTRALRHHGRTRGPRPRRDPRLHGKPDHVRVGSPAAGAGDALDPVAPGGRRPLTAGLEQPILHTERRRTGSGAAWAEVGGGAWCATTSGGRHESRPTAASCPDHDADGDRGSGQAAAIAAAKVAISAASRCGSGSTRSAATDASRWRRPRPRRYSGSRRRATAAMRPARVTRSCLRSAWRTCRRRLVSPAATHAVRTAARTMAAVRRASAGGVSARTGAKAVSCGLPASVHESFTSRARVPRVGSVHRGWSLKGAPTRTETYSMRQAPSSGIR
jgi:hypothetical protein